MPSLVLLLLMQWQEERSQEHSGTAAGFHDCEHAMNAETQAMECWTEAHHLEHARLPSHEMRVLQHRARRFLAAACSASTLLIWRCWCVLPTLLPPLSGHKLKQLMLWPCL